jgi:uncharacterized protein (DUF2235 family)
VYKAGHHLVFSLIQIIHSSPYADSHRLTIFTTMSKSISKQCTAKLKRIVICCDGTWQSATGLDRKTGAVSNVAKLCQILASAGTENGTEYQQVVYYDAGVGTGAIGSVMSAYQGRSEAR